MGKLFDKIREIKTDFFDELTLEKKIILTFSGSLAIFFTVVGYMLVSRVTENNIGNIEKSVRSELMTRDRAILSIERSVKGKIKILSKDSELLGESGEVARVLREFAKDNEEFSQVFFGKNDGEFSETPKVARETAFDPRNTVWYKDATAAGENGMTIVTAPFQGVDGKAKVGFYSSAKFYGASYGVVGGALDFVDLVKMTGDTDNLIILDNDDNIVFNFKNSENLFNKLNKANMGDLSLVGQKNEGISKISLESANMLAVVYKSETTKFKYIKLIDYKEAASQADSTKYFVIIAFLSMFIISLILSRILYKDIRKSFINIEAQTEAIGEGKLDDITTVKETADEVGRLSFAFGKMAGNVKSRLMTMETESQNLRAMLKEIYDKIEVIKPSSESMAANINEIKAANEAKIKNINDMASETQTLEDCFTNFSDLQNKMKNDLAKLVGEINLVAKNFEEQREANENKSKGEKEEFEANFKKETASLKGALEKIADNASEISLMAFSAALEAAKGKDEKSKYAKIAEDIRKLADSMANFATGERNGVEKLAPKLIESPAIDIKNELSSLLTQSKNLETAISSADTTIMRLKVAKENTKKAADKIFALAKDSETIMENAEKSALNTASDINQMENIASKAFE